MAPTPVTLQLLRGVLRVVHKNVRALGQPPQIAFVFQISGLIVGRVDDRANGSFDSISQATLRMVEPAGGDARFSDVETIPARDVGKIETPRHGLKVHGEIWMGRLRL